MRTAGATIGSGLNGLTSRLLWRRRFLGRSKSRNGAVCFSISPSAQSGAVSRAAKAQVRMASSCSDEGAERTKSKTC